MTQVLGIHSSPIKNGNTAWLLDHAMREAEKAGEVTTETVALGGLTLADCRHCNWCMTKQTPDRLCSIQDDASPILEKIRDCDVLILASPVYFSRLSGTMACLTTGWGSKTFTPGPITRRPAARSSGSIRP